MTKTEFRALRKEETLEFLLSKFDDPDGDFEAMSAEELTQFGIDNWDEAWEVSDEQPDEPDAPDEAGEAATPDEGSDETPPEDQADEEAGQGPEEEETPRNLDLGAISKERRLAMEAAQNQNLDLG